jgi:peptide/nickel transport system permease protein
MDPSRTHRARADCSSVVTYIGRRLVLMVPALLGTSLAVFLLLRFIPGDVVDVLLGSELTLAPDVRASLRKVLGLDEPIPVQYLGWIWDLLRGDLGRSLRSGQSVLQIIMQRLPVTSELAILSLTLAVILAVPLGVISAVRRNTWLDLAARLFGLLGLSFPTFWFATMRILGASLAFKWLPAVIFVGFTDNPLENLGQMALPTISLALPLMAIITRLTRSAMLEVLQQEYVRTARAKGLKDRRVIYRHALRNALIPMITIIGIQLGQLFGRAVVVEQIFGLPGIGLLLLNGIYQRDYPVVQGGIMLLAVTFLLLNLLVDVLYAYLDPRIRYG